MERVRRGARPCREVVVDYAHTPDALDKALAALRPLASERGGELWCVFGCGGDRDPAKRPLMGAIAARLADHVVVTSDNPRSEEPAAIIGQILLGAIGRDAVDVIDDRARGDRATLVGAAAPDDVVLIAGKGHEDYQEIARRAHAVLRRRRMRCAGAEASAGLTRRIDAPMMTLARGGRDGCPARALVGDARDADRARPQRHAHACARAICSSRCGRALRRPRLPRRRRRPRGAVAALAQRGVDERRPARPGRRRHAGRAAARSPPAGARRFALPLIAVTGSNGKTTVTQMIASILRAALRRRARSRRTATSTTTSACR